eukprot:735229-Alexandrium_andersonii.AAC.1
MEQCPSLPVCQNDNDRTNSQRAFSHRGVVCERAPIDVATSPGLVDSVHSLSLFPSPLFRMEWPWGNKSAALPRCAET